MSKYLLKTLGALTILAWCASISHLVSMNNTYLGPTILVSVVLTMFCQYLSHGQVLFNRKKAIMVVGVLGVITFISLPVNQSLVLLFWAGMSMSMTLRGKCVKN